MGDSLVVNPPSFAPLVGGADYGEIIFERSEGLSVRFEDSKVSDIEASSSRGMGLRFLRRRDGAVETLQASGQALDSDSAARLRTRLLPKKAPSAVALGPRRDHKPFIRRPPQSVALDDKTALLRRIDAVLRREYAGLRQVTLRYGESRRELTLINSEGAYQSQEKVSVLFSATVVAEENGVLQTGYEAIGGLKGYELIEEGRVLSLARQAAERARLKLKVPKATAGEMPVVLSSSAGGTFIHEAIGHSLEADHVQEGSSPAYRGKIGRVVAPEMISVIDDPTLPFYRGSFAFDDEGSEARPTVLVEKGVLRDYLYDRSTALRDGKASNGHGRRQSFRDPPIPRMSNLYIAPGPDDPAAIIKSLKKGLFVTRMGGGEVNTANGEFVFEVDEGYWIEDGVVKRMVRDANLLGVGPEILRSIDRVGCDIGWGIGTCGKDGQGVPVADGQPTVRIPKILVGGAS